MDKLKQAFKKDGDDHSSGATTSTGTSGEVSTAKHVTLHTTLGDIKVELFQDQTPKVNETQ